MLHYQNQLYKINHLIKVINSSYLYLSVSSLRSPLNIFQAVFWYKTDDFIYHFLKRYVAARAETLLYMSFKNYLRLSLIQIQNTNKHLKSLSKTHIRSMWFFVTKLHHYHLSVTFITSRNISLSYSCVRDLINFKL